MSDSPRKVIWLLYFIGFLDLFAVSLVIPLISKHARALGASPTVAGFIGSIYGALQLFASPLIGEWSDKSGRRRVLLYCLLLSSLGYFTLGLSVSLMILALARVPTGLFKHSQELSRTYLADVTPMNDHSQVFGTFNAVSSIGFIVGPVLGGHIAQIEGGFHICAVLCACIFVINFALVLLFVPAADESMTSLRKTNTHKEALRKKATARWNPFAFLSTFREIEWIHLWDIFLIRFFMGFAVLIYRTNFTMWLDYRFEASTTTVGYLTSFSGIIGTVTGFLVGSIASYYNNNSAQLLLRACSIQMGVIVALTLAPSLWFVVVLIIPLSIANAVARVASANITIERGRGQDKGVVLGLGASILSMARMLAPLVGGVAQDLHISGPTLAGSVLALIGVSVMIFSPQFRESLKGKVDSGEKLKSS